MQTDRGLVREETGTVNREHWFTRLLVLVVIALAAWFAMGQTRPGRPAVIEAEGFVLRDSRGRTRAHLSLIADESVALGLANQSGDTRVALVIDRHREGDQ